jgi:hypothetical protein
VMTVARERSFGMLYCSELHSSPRTDTERGEVR